LTAPGAVGQEINLGHSEPIEIRQLIALLEDALGTKAVIDQQPEKPGDMPITYADLSKAERILGYRPQVPIETGIREFVQWYRGYKKRA
jgi:UDP-glucuronate 4-epimerase